MHTRTTIKARHALIAPDGHVASAFPGWENATGYVMLSPAMGAGLSQILITFDEGGGSCPFLKDGCEHFVYVEKGSCKFQGKGLKDVALGETGFAFIPAGTPFTIEATAETRITLFRKAYAAHPGITAPPIVSGHANDVPDEAFLGNERARLQTLLPIDPRYDLAVNIFTYQPGATLPFVETHIMEHGLLMLKGQGVYRLENDYYPVEAGDAIWMAPYCPQWFAAIGDSPASYLYYKDIHRLP